MVEIHPIEEAPHDDTPILVFVSPHWLLDVKWYEVAPVRGRVPGWYQDGWKLVEPTRFAHRDLEYEALLKEAQYGKAPAR
jgi:hypothetical protein